MTRKEILAMKPEALREWVREQLVARDIEVTFSRSRRLVLKWDGDTLRVADETVRYVAGLLLEDAPMG